MNILLISPLPPPTGGIATWTKLFLESKLVQERNIDLVNTAVVGNRVGNFYKTNVYEEIKRLIGIFLQIKNFIKKTKFDIVHLNSSCSKSGLLRDYLIALFVTRKKVKLVVHYHCDTEYMVMDNLSKYFFKKLSKIANQVFCLNDSSKKHIKRISGEEGIIIPNFINMNLMAINKRMDLAERIKEVIFVGHIVKSKGCIEIIKVAEKLPEINFTMIGLISEEIDKIQKPKNLQLVGEVSKEEVVDYMLSSDLLLFPTYTEGFPNVVLEAMASGLPILSTPVGAIPDMVEDQGGILVEVGDVDGLVHAMERLQNKRLRISMSNWNREKVRKTYTADLVIEKIIEEYKWLCKKQKPNI